MTLRDVTLRDGLQLTGKPLPTDHKIALVRELLALGAKDVAVLDADGVEQRVPIEQLKVNHRFIVRPGEKVAADGVVYKGSSAIDRSLLTGESVPVDVHPAAHRYR